MSKQDRQGVRTAADLERKYNWGQTFAEVYGLVADAQKAAADALLAVEGLDSEAIFNRLTDYGRIQGIYRDGDDNIYVNASYIKSGKLAAEYIDAESLSVNAANVMGTLLANQFKLGGEINLYDTIDSDTVIGKLGYMPITITEPDSDPVALNCLGFYAEENTYLATKGRTVILAEHNVTVSTNGNIIYNCGSSSGHMFYGYVMAFNGSPIHARSSDRRLKHDINYEQTDKMVDLFDQLKPVTFGMNNFKPDALHAGFIAQDVVEAAENVGLSGILTDIDSNGMYVLDYGEITAVLVAKIKQLEREIQEWKN